MALAFSEPCERNKQPILERLVTEIGGARHVLEIGSGTGQHVVHFAAALPDILWTPSDLATALPALQARLDLEAPDNVQPPVALDVRAAQWPGRFDVVYTANTLHIVSWPEVEAMFRGIGRVLEPDGRLIIYGPFLYKSETAADSNLSFDRRLRDRDPDSGLRHFEAVDDLARAQGLTPTADHPMPANNRLLVWRRRR